jgi:hypothetical protein
LTHLLAQDDIPSLGSLLKLLPTLGGTSIMALGCYLWYTGKLARGADLDKMERRHAAEVEKMEVRHAEDLRKAEDRGEKFERMAWELSTTNRQLSGSAERATNLAEKAVSQAGAAHER